MELINRYHHHELPLHLECHYLPLSIHPFKPPKPSLHQFEIILHHYRQSHQTATVMVMYSPDHIRIILNTPRDIPPLTHIEHHTSRNPLLLVIARDHLRQSTHIWAEALQSFHMDERGDIPDHL